VALRTDTGENGNPISFPAMKESEIGLENSASETKEAAEAPNEPTEFGVGIDLPEISQSPSIPHKTVSTPGTPSLTGEKRPASEIDNAEEEALSEEDEPEVESPKKKGKGQNAGTGGRGRGRGRGRGKKPKSK
jgi:hypothetical protein